MRTHWKQLVLAMALAQALLPALAQTAGPRNSATDPALLDKANGGDPAAQVQVGESCAAGRGAAQDLKQAAEWYRKAAEQGDVSAQATLGLLYSLGQGVPKSDVEAYFWLDLAASVKSPKQEQYAANRQLIGTHITTDELADVEERVAKWQAAHPRPAATE